MDSENTVSVPELQPTQLLRDVVISKIVPSSVTEHPKAFDPCIYDLNTFDSYVTVLYLYKLEDARPSTFAQFVDVVKVSLSRVLTLYFPLAGKWVVTEDASLRKLICNDEGAVFVQAAVDDQMRRFFNPADFKPPGELIGEFAVPGFVVADVHKTPENKEWPCLIVQVTSFRCAGVCLAVSWNHMTMDGFAFDRFIKAWWEIADTGQTSVEPSFERSFAPSVSDKARVLGIALDMKNVGDALSKRFRNFPSSSAAQFPVVNKLINVQMASVERLRQTAREDRDAGPLQRHERLTTFECISTQIWRCFARLCRDEDDLIHLRFTVECRKKCRVPPIADDFAGNMYLFIGPPASTGREVLDKSFTRGACEIHEVVNSVTPASVASLLDNQFKSIDAMASVVNEEFPNSHSAAKSLLPVTITSWSHFDNFYKLDFGFGPPILSAPCSLFNVVNDPVVYLLPHDPNSVDAAPILLRASPTIHALLSRDPEFLDLIS